MTVIYSDFGDEDTKVLSHMWKGIEGATIVTNGAKKAIREALENEKDTLLLCGHGTPTGLLMPTEEGGIPGLHVGYAFSRDDISLIRAERIIGIWCYASTFARNCGLKGFYSSMFISSGMEAALMGVSGVSGEEITASEVLFAKRINSLLREDIPLSRWKEKLQSIPLTNDVERFNYDGLYYAG